MVWIRNLVELSELGFSRGEDKRDRKGYVQNFCKCQILLPKYAEVRITPIGVLGDKQ